MKNLDESITNSSNLDEAVSNFSVDLSDPKNIANAFLNPMGGIMILNQARKKEKLAKEKLKFANELEKKQYERELDAAQKEVAKAESELAASKTTYVPSIARETEEKKFPWKTVGFVGGGLVVATGLFFLIRYFVKKK